MWGLKILVIMGKIDWGKLSWKMPNRKTNIEGVSSEIKRTEGSVQCLALVL